MCESLAATEVRSGVAPPGELRSQGGGSRFANKQVMAEDISR
jgi:hypothetical protein